VLLLNECLLLFISLSTQSRNFLIRPRIKRRMEKITNRLQNLVHQITKQLNVPSRWRFTLCFTCDTDEQLFTTSGPITHNSTQTICEVQPAQRGRRCLSVIGPAETRALCETRSQIVWKEMTQQILKQQYKFTYIL
jgi:hypothetical protein